MNGADTAFVMVSAALVMLMTPGLALFYGGMVRSKNVLGTIMQNFIMLAVVGILWAIYGYSLAFGPDVGHFIGDHRTHMGGTVREVYHSGGRDDAGGIDSERERRARCGNAGRASPR